jgi:hypothetical protein
MANWHCHSLVVFSSFLGMTIIGCAHPFPMSWTLHHLTIVTFPDGQTLSFMDGPSKVSQGAEINMQR